ncbi:hypothetical protein [Arenimonas sp.]|uniref:hypothetical protein n=1 Tax=Arenimonas sp. TaxID=1872635 RepID=UPI0039E2783F
MKARIYLLRTLFVVVLAPFAIVAFAVLGGIDVMNYLAREYFCDPGLANCNLLFVGFLQHVIAYWWFVAFALHSISTILLAIYILLDVPIEIRQRLAWLVGVLFAGVIAAPIYCFVRLRQLHANLETSIAA